MVMEFDNADDLFRYLDGVNNSMRQQYEDMDCRVRTTLTTKGQKYAQHSGYGFLIFGEVIESAYEEDRALQAETPWYPMVRAYSMVCPEGEMGTIPITDMIPITGGMFERARACNWDVDVESVVESAAREMERITGDGGNE